MRQQTDIQTLAWPLAQLGDAIEALARREGLTPHPLDAADDITAQADKQALGRWIEARAAWAGLEAEPATTTYAATEQFLRQTGPLLLRLPGDEPRFLLMLGAGIRKVQVFCPDLRVRSIHATTLADTLRRPLETAQRPRVERVLDAAEVPPQRRARARAAMLRRQLGSTLLQIGWSLRTPPGASFRRQLQRAGLHWAALGFAGAHTAYYLLWTASWGLIGQALLQAQLDWRALSRWALLLLALIPMRMLAIWSQGRFAIGVGALLKRRLLDGALRLEPDEIRRQGAGQLLSRVIESESVETLALSGGFTSLMATIELLLAAMILLGSPAGAAHALLLAIWVALTLLLVARFYQHRRHWTAARLAMSHDLIEQMTGHRTRLVQQPPTRWHEKDKRALQQYHDLSLPMDRLTGVLIAVAPRGWLILSLAALAPAALAGADAAALGIGLGGALLAFQALSRLYAGVGYLGNALIAWQQVALMFRASARPTEPIRPALAVALAPHDLRPGGPAAAPVDAPALLSAQGLSFRYPGRTEDVVRDCAIELRTGERLLLEGATGGGKSTLAALLTGLRMPASGTLLLHGHDRHALGQEGWRRLVAAAPQFHENYVLNETLAFNLLMGRRWPPLPQDLDDAEALCHVLGLGELLSRMPSGLQQIVGETGWQLSHGERSRLYIARALLQGAELLILDESFAALDPQTLRLTMRNVLDYAPTLLVIAHP